LPLKVLFNDYVDIAGPSSGELRQTDGQTDGQTDDMRSQDRALHYSASRGNKL